MAVSPLNGRESTSLLERTAKSLYFCMKPLSRSSAAGSGAVSINIRRRSARARQYSERSIGLAVLKYQSKKLVSQKA
jgi:hypothetical protein